MFVVKYFLTEIIQFRSIYFTIAELKTNKNLFYQLEIVDVFVRLKSCGLHKILLSIFVLVFYFFMNYDIKIYSQFSFRLSACIKSLRNMRSFLDGVNLSHLYPRGKCMYFLPTNYLFVYITTIKNISKTNIIYIQILNFSYQ